MFCEKKLLRNNNKVHEIKIIQIICCTYCKLWLNIMETLKKWSQSNWKRRKASNIMYIESNSRIQDRIISLHIFPLSLYHELHISLLLHKILTGKTDLQWKKFISVKFKGQKKICEYEKKNKSKKFRLQKSEPDFSWDPAILRTPSMNTSNSISWSRNTYKN